jgi:glycosyltransferase involved in cell wall biosynthesis
VAQLAEITATLGRPLRVLHIGNIANNAYINAKIMRRYGIEADVLMISYYHMMGCPEWEDGEIESLAGTQFEPDWARTKVTGFKRPDWFVQGPVQVCIPYLVARASGERTRAQVWHWILRLHLYLRGAQDGWRRPAYQLFASLPHSVRALRGLRKRALRKRHKSDSWVAGDTGKTLAALATPEQATPGRNAANAKPAWHLGEDVGRVLGETDTESLDYLHGASKLRRVLPHYDIVQGYALDGIYALLGGMVDRYACYEHGTLRDLPFEDTPRGRMCAVAYRNAAAVFITNTDCVAAADRLGITKTRQHPIPHIFDSDKIEAFRRRHRMEFYPTNAPVHFIAPARHQWTAGDTASGAKGNDIVIRAAHLLAREELDFKIIFIRWGEEVAESHALIRELGVERHFVWIDTIPKQRLWQYYMSVNGVLDQFVIPAFGGIAFEAMALERPLFTRIDEPVFREFFGSVPPLFNVHSAEGLAAAMVPLIRDPSCYDAVSALARTWIAEHHSAERSLEVQLLAYSKILAGG